MKRFLPIAAGCLLALAAAPARAAENVPPEVQALIKKMMVDYNTGSFEAALDEANQAYHLDPLPALLFNIGQFHKALHHWEQAEFFFHRYLSERPDAPNRELVEKLLAEVQEKEKEAARPPPPTPAGGPAPIIIQAPPPVSEPPPPPPGPEAPLLPIAAPAEPKLPANFGAAGKGIVDWYPPTDEDDHRQYNSWDPWGSSTSIGAELYLDANTTQALVKAEFGGGSQFAILAGYATGTNGVRCTSALSCGLFLDNAYVVGIGFQFIAPLKIADFKKPDIQIGVIWPEWRFGLASDFDHYYTGWMSFPIVGLRFTFFDIFKFELRALQPGMYIAYQTDHFSPLSVGGTVGLGGSAELAFTF